MLQARLGDFARGEKNALAMQKFHNIQPQFHPRPPAEAKSTFLNDPKPPGPEPKADRLTTTGPVVPKIHFSATQAEVRGHVTGR